VFDSHNDLFPRLFLLMGAIDSCHVHSGTQKVFQQLLGAGKVGDVKRFWPDLEQVTGWITQAGGVAVLAHPQRYRLSGRKQRDLVNDFASFGGRALELALPGLSPQQRSRWVELAASQNLLGSAGSDFHQDDKPWSRLGQVPAMPSPIQPIWKLFAS
jgi:predicted metal-dependent phosphoesterase TrpH